MQHIITVKQMSLFKHVLLPTLCVVLCAVSTTAKAQDKAVFPDSLFEVKLGGIYTVSEGKDIGTIPVQKFTGAEKLLGSGIHYYFKPLKDYKMFKYIEKHKGPDDTYFETSFHLYLLPVIPSTVKNSLELANLHPQWEVAAIGWCDKTEKEEDAYYWAIDLCKNVKIDLEREPDINDEYKFKIYTCKFTEGNRRLEVMGLYGYKQFKLSYTSAFFDKKDEAIDTVIRKIHMGESKPY
jgi:hypothetical protein